ncbi:hypothetical protein ARALYDRAFT_313192 [Arabidopsis lyrata subsp. lyrata]|uniref:Armadillo/beta-catenin repeat family protein n=1 Tax=Arabidopsis lyrata subsp. lyrata TaxID=81972 RepID=D7KMP9_ARALL|nr:hypothetical protein ARALYDRAFT_313192 [Arabidopsis lyrata subsp. lyrata]
MDPIESVEYNGFETTNGDSHNNDHGWKKVVYPKRNRKQKPADQAAVANVVSGKLIPNGALSNGGDNIFRSLEEQAEDRHRRILAAKKASDVADASDGVRSKRRSNGYGDEGYDFDDSDSEIAVGKENLKVEEVKKPKVKKEKKPKVTLAEAAAKIDVSNLAAFLVEASIPLCHIPEAVYKTSADWINQRPIEALGAFVLWGLDCILADFAVQQGGAKSGKKGAQNASSKSQVAIFVAVAMVLRKKPDALTNILPTLRENPKYQGQDKLPVTVWMMAQASQGDISVGLYSLAHNLLPVVSSKSCNPQSRDLILQLVERILSNPKARTILVNGAVRKGERLIPPPSFEILVRLTFPASSARVKENLYTDNLEASVAVLKKLIDEWEERSVKLTPAETLTLNQTMKSLRQKNEEALAEGGNGSSQSLYKDADKYCKVIAGKLSSGGCIKSIATTAALLAATGFAGAAAVSANPEAIAYLKNLVDFSEKKVRTLKNQIASQNRRNLLVSAFSTSLVCFLTVEARKQPRRRRRRELSFSHFPVLIHSNHRLRHGFSELNSSFDRSNSGETGSDTTFEDGEEVRGESSSGVGDSYVALFVGMLGLDNDPLDREQAIVALWKYSLGGKKCVDAIMQFHGCLSLIVNLLKSESSSACEAAAGLIRSIAAVNLYRESVAESGALEEIIALLSRPSLATVVKEQCICALWNLTVDEEIREKVADFDILRLLISFLEDDDVNVKEAAGGVLANLALSRSNHKILVEVGVIPKLAKVLKGDNTENKGSKVIRKEARNVLLELAKDEYYRILVIEEGVVPIPIIGADAYKSFRPDLYSWPSLPDGINIEQTAKAPSRFGASELLLGLNVDKNVDDVDEAKMKAIIGRTNQQFLARIGAIEFEKEIKSEGPGKSQQLTLLPCVDGVARLVLILGLADELAVTRAAESIADASINEDMRVSFMEAGAVKPLVQLLANNNKEAVKLPVIRALKNLSLSSFYQLLEYLMGMNRKEVLDAAVFSRLVQIAKSASPNLLRNAISVIEFGIVSNPNMDTIISGDITTVLDLALRQKVLEEPENEAEELEKHLLELEEAGLTISAASRLLTKLVDSESFRQTIDVAVFTELLRKILKSSLPLHYKDWVAACLVKLTALSSPPQPLNNPINIEVTLYKTIPSLVEQMSFSSSPEAKETAVLELNRIISEGVPESTQTLASHGGIEPLVKLLEERNERCVEASLSVLYNLSMDSENHTAIIRAGAVPVLRRIVMSQRPQWEKALRLLRNLPV